MEKHQKNNRFFLIPKVTVFLLYKVSVECRFTNHAIRPKTDAIYTTSTGILRLSPNNRTAKVVSFGEREKVERDEKPRIMKI